MLKVVYTENYSEFKAALENLLQPGRVAAQLAIAIHSYYSKTIGVQIYMDEYLQAVKEIGPVFELRTAKEESQGISPKLMVLSLMPMYPFNLEDSAHSYGYRFVVAEYDQVAFYRDLLTQVPCLPRHLLRR